MLGQEALLSGVHVSSPSQGAVSLNSPEPELPPEPPLAPALPPLDPPLDPPLVPPAPLCAPAAPAAAPPAPAVLLAPALPPLAPPTPGLPAARLPPTPLPPTGLPAAGAPAVAWPGLPPDAPATPLGAPLAPECPWWGSGEGDSLLHASAKAKTVCGRRKGVSRWVSGLTAERVGRSSGRHQLMTGEGHACANFVCRVLVARREGEFDRVGDEFLKWRVL